MGSPLTSSSSSFATSDPGMINSDPPPPVVQNAHRYLTIKLTPHNYLYWHTLITPYHISQKLIGFVDGSRPSLPPLVTPANSSTSKVNPDFLLWEQNDQHVITILLSSLIEEVFSVITGKKTSTAIWAALEYVYASASQTRILTLHEELYELRQKGDSVTAYLYRAKKIADSLAAIGRPLMTEQLNMHNFEGLHPEYGDLKTSLTVRKEPVSFEDLNSLLLTHEFVYKNDAPNTGGPLAFYSAIGRESSPGQGATLQPPPSLGFTPTQLAYLQGLGHATSGSNSGSAGFSAGRNNGSCGFQPSATWSAGPTQLFGPQQGGGQQFNNRHGGGRGKYRRSDRARGHNFDGGSGGSLSDLPRL